MSARHALLACTLAACAVACGKASPQQPAATQRHYTFRALAGVSMGGVGASRIVAAHPDRFDAAGFLGGPVDAALLARTLETQRLGGFCPRDALEATLSLDLADGGNRLDRPDGVAGCTQAPAKPPSRYSWPQRFNHWHYTVNGGHFDRAASLDIFRDLVLALGNPLSANPNSPVVPAPLTQAQFDAATCAQPAVVKHYVDARYSPHGERDAITFCDGEAPVKLCADGTLVDWCRAAALAGRALAQAGDEAAFCSAHGGGARDADQSADADVYFAHHGELPGCWAGTKKVSFALALDLNGNGRRDYHEPVVFALHEPFRDVGRDGCPDELEDGKGGCTSAAQSPFAQGVKDPNGDNYDAALNPSGTEGDGLWEPGEPYDDVGLDGVAGTADTGEGNGSYDVSPGFARWLAGDLRQQLPRLSAQQRRSLDLYMEGGIRDIFDLGAQAEALAGGVQLAMPDGLQRFLDFASIPPAGGGAWPDGYDPQRIDPRLLGRNVFIPYGSANPTPAQARAGDGDHVGTVTEVYDRFLTFFRWLSVRWDPVLRAQKTAGSGRTDQVVYQSAVLGAARDYAVSLPPGYDDPANAQKRYPVLFLLHGYGQGPQDFSGTGAFVNILGNVGEMREIIVVYPSGRCCFSGPGGARACTESDAQGRGWESLGYVRECALGSFFVNAAAPGGSRYEDALFELMAEIDGRYRTLPPADGPAN